MSDDDEHFDEALANDGDREEDDFDPCDEDNWHYDD